MDAPCTWGLPVSADARLCVSLTTSEPWAFDGHDDEVVRDLAEAVGQSCGDVLERRAAQAHALQMECKLASGAVIEQAKGIVMAMRGCSPAEAFAFLVELSQVSNTKLRLVAQALVVDAATPAHTDAAARR